MKERIQDFMTRQPWTVQADDSLTIAREMLDLRRIHQLPVLDAGEITGMISARDLRAAGQRMGVVAELMVPAATVAMDTELNDVLDLMSAERYDAVVVTDAGRVEGIFTTTDALRILTSLLRRPEGRVSVHDVDREVDDVRR
ncbi:MAG: CBS domain-containing protein [Kofleriaceae bacterium]|nr:CBS domain-containing protein [Kofleriaceae bacterium]